MSQEYYDHLNEGEKYSCDKCEVVNLSANEYDNYIIMQYHYCEPCWNYVKENLIYRSCDKEVELSW